MIYCELDKRFDFSENLDIIKEILFTRTRRQASGCRVCRQRSVRINAGLQGKMWAKAFLRNIMSECVARELQLIFKEMTRLLREGE